MMVQWTEYPLLFNFTARTSREVMTRRSTYLLRRYDASCAGGWRYSEANYFSSLAPESHSEFIGQLRAFCAGELDYSSLTSSAVICAADMLEMHMPDSAWIHGYDGIPINGLIWMADKKGMREQIESKLKQGFRVLKLKIGGIKFEDEIDLLHNIRSCFSCEELEIRLDANGSFPPGEAVSRLDSLSRFGIHSIEQPVKAGQLELMAGLCKNSPIDIALDEELIGINDEKSKHDLLNILSPAYIILKPSLCGGLSHTRQWIETAESKNIGWWITSALESSVGLYYLAAFVSGLNVSIPQGLGTGQIYKNNIGSCLHMHDARLWGGSMDFDLELLNSLQWQ